MDDDELIAALAAELERVADYLILLSRGRVQVAGEVDDLLACHRVLTGPADPARSHHVRPARDRVRRLDTGRLRDRRPGRHAHRRDRLAGPPPGGLNPRQPAAGG